MTNEQALNILRGRFASATLHHDGHICADSDPHVTGECPCLGSSRLVLPTFVLRDEDAGAEERIRQAMDKYGDYSPEGWN